MTITTPERADTDTLSDRELLRREVWYCCYGSNLHRDRFLKYIHGGKPTAQSKVVHPGCRDRTEPKESRPFKCALAELCFAGHSTFWGGGGTCFIRPASAGDKGKPPVLMRKYRVTAEQFLDVVFQENEVECSSEQQRLEHVFLQLLRETVTPETTTTAAAAASTDQSRGYREIPFLRGSLYGQLVHLGHADGAPIFSFTTAMEIVENEEEEGQTTAAPDQAAHMIVANVPCSAYITTIAKGLVATGHFGRLEHTIPYFERVLQCGNGKGITADDVRRLIGIADTAPSNENQVQ